MRNNIAEEGHGLYLISSTTASFVAAILSNPFDVAKSRIMSQPICHETGRGLKYNGMLHCMYLSVKTEGPLILWAGLLSTFLRLVPNITITFAVMEQLKKWF